ncbi:MAG: hypothetical protein K1000chlam3_00428 [Chlamydiae bacterium]|nr:hypothetical protein [Chlamydiota bacterium]
MKRIFLILFLHSIAWTSAYDHIKPLPFDPHGWFNNQTALEKIFNTREIHTVIELGSWAGLSTIFFGQAVGPAGRVYAIDTWQGSPTEDAHKNDPRLKNLYQLFLSNIKHAELQEIVIPFRMRTDEAARALDLTADLIYVDADHTTEQVCRDIINWHSHLNPGGIICGDDWDWKSVRKGVKKAAQHLHMQIETEGNFWFFR